MAANGGQVHESASGKARASEVCVAGVAGVAVSGPQVKQERKSR